MTLPTTGVSWKEAHGDSYNPNGLFKGTITNVLMRTYLGSLTSLADPLTGTVTGDDGNQYFSPFAADGMWRDDLLSPDFPGGAWVDPGSIADEGTEVTSDFSTDEVYIGQMIRPARIDENTQKDEFSFTAEEIVNPVVRRLDANQSLVSLPDAGSVLAYPLPSEPTRVAYQGILFTEDGDKRLAFIFPNVTRTKKGNITLKRGGDRAIGIRFTYGALLCPFTGTPMYVVPEGAGYRGLGGAPVFSAAPVATPGGAGAASVVFVIPTLPRDPAPDTFTYTWEVKVGAGAWTPTVPASSTPSGSSVTASFTALTAGSTQFRVTAVAASQLSTTSAASTAVTIT